jgi:hypothetical protein
MCGGILIPPVYGAAGIDYISKNHGGAQEYIIVAGNACINRDIVLHLYVIAEHYLWRDNYILPDIAVFPNLAAGHNMGEMPDFGTISNYAAFINYSSFVVCVSHFLS